MKRKEKQPVPETWNAPMSFPATTVARLLREEMDNLGWEYERESDQKIYTRVMVIMPLMKGAHVYRYRVHSPFEITIETYDTRPTHSGYVPRIGIKGLNEENFPHVKKLLDEVMKRLPRPMWEFTLQHKLMNGLLSPEFREAKVMWAALGYDTRKKRKKDV